MNSDGPILLLLAGFVLGVMAAVCVSLVRGGDNE